MIKHYQERCAYSLDCENGTDESFYGNHTSAMTAEGLHSKSDIAAELAVRDAQIHFLVKELTYHTNGSIEEILNILPQFLLGED